MIIRRYTDQNNAEDYVAFDWNSKESEFYLQGISRLVDTIAMSDSRVVGAGVNRRWITQFLSLGRINDRINNKRSTVRPLLSGCHKFYSGRVWTDIGLEQ